MKKHTFINENGDKITVNSDNANRYYMGYRVHFICGKCKNQIAGDDERGTCLHISYGCLAFDDKSNRVYCKKYIKDRK